MTVVLPALPYRQSPNQSARAVRRPHLIVEHTWGNPPALTAKTARARFEANVAYLRNPSTPYQASAHVVYGGCIGDPAGLAAQLVPWDRKAWTEMSFNSVSYSIEAADAIWTPSGKGAGKTRDEAGLAQLARITAFLCFKTGIPAVWSRDPLNKPGLVRHYDLGAAGGGHYDPTTDDKLWRRFVAMTAAELRNGGFRKTWGVGRFYPIR